MTRLTALAILGCRRNHDAETPRRLGGVTIEPSLAWLLQPLTVETFLDQIWAATHHHTKRRCAGYFDGLLAGPSAAEELLQLYRREPSAVRLTRGKDKRDPDSYRLVDGSLDLERIRADMASGYTIIVDGVERYSRAIASLSRSIEIELNFPTQVNAYITPPGSQGLVPHYDDHDVLILQIQGSKTWHLYDRVEVPPHKMRCAEKAVPTARLSSPIDLRLEVGDVLYLPRGRVHAAETDFEPSVHLTVGIHAPTVLTLAIGALNSLSFDDDRLNTPLPPRHLDDEDVHATLGALLRDAVTTLQDSRAVAEGLEALAEVLVRRGRCPPIGQISRAAEIDGQTLVRKYRPLYSRVKAAADGVALQFATLSINAGSDHEAAMLFMSDSTEPFRVRELPGLAAKQQIALVRSLIVSGFLVRLPED